MKIIILGKELNERNVGKRATIMLQAAAHRNTRGFSAHIAGSPKESIREAKGNYQGKTYIVARNKKYCLNKIILKMERHGFVQHLGVPYEEAANVPVKNHVREATDIDTIKCKYRYVRF